MTAAVLDEERINCSHGDLQSRLSELSEILKKLRDDEVRIYKCSNAWLAQITEHLKLYNVLFEGNEIDADLKLLLQTQIDGFMEWDSEESALQNSREFVSQRIASKEPYCCIVTVPNESIITLAEGSLHSIATYKAAIEYYRDIHRIEDHSADQLLVHANLPFPNLFFKPQISAQISSFSRSFRDIRSDLMEALGALNDILPQLLVQFNGNPSDLSKTFNAQARFTISPESPKTRRNVDAMKERDVDFGSCTIRCEWHLKLEPHKDRIHFNFGDERVAGSRILIGIFCEHLTT